MIKKNTSKKCRSAVSQLEFAQLRGVDKSTVTHWKRQGYLVFTGGLIDVAATNARLAERPPARRGGQTKHLDDATAIHAANEFLKQSGAPHSLAEAARIKENYLAKLRQLEYEEAARLVVPAAQIQTAWGTILLRFRSAALRFPTAMTPRVAACRTEAQIFAVLQDGIYGMLSHLAEGKTDDYDGN